MTEMGFIHFDCLCGADFYYVVCEPDGDELMLKGILEKLIRPARHAIFTENDGQLGTCPYCEATIELPTPEVVAFFNRRSERLFQRWDPRSRSNVAVKNYQTQP